MYVTLLFPELGTLLNKTDKVPAIGSFHLLGEMSKPAHKSCLLVMEFSKKNKAAKDSGWRRPP